MSRFTVLLFALLCVAAIAVQAAVVEEQDALEASAGVQAGCSNIPPNPAPGKQFYNCAQQKGYKKCSASFMVPDGKCLRECGKCSGACKESAPDKSHSCAAQAGWGKCGCSWMKGHCGCTCGPHAGDNSKLYCADNPSSGGGSGGSHTGSGSNEASNGEIKLTSAIVKASKSIKALNLHSDAASTPKQPSSVYTVGDGYDTRKKAVVASLKKAGLSAAQVKLGLAVAMQETNEFKGRDTTKTGSSTNYSFYNMNQDLIQRLMGKNYNCKKLNAWSSLQAASNIFAKCLKTYGTDGCIDFIRGGATGLIAHKAGKADCPKYDCLGYRQAMASYVAIFDKWPIVMSDSRRVAMDTKHV